MTFKEGTITNNNYNMGNGTNDSLDNESNSSKNSTRKVD